MPSTDVSATRPSTPEIDQAVSYSSHGQLAVIARSSRSHHSQLRLQPVETSGRIGTSQDMDREGSSRTSKMISEAIFSSSKACVVESVPCDPRTGITSGNWHRSPKLNTPAVAASISGPFARSDANSRCWSAGSVLA
ncbi:hypothetical protein CMUS01_05186 [Colletotrichum musicola]|uniref:Uncharacterized protein n=1 Tax=Colletotrichum musicola TaxID=2175873 RepID=A0A8H6NLH8_9PEZI|nr:hypothetical protein CMUS01_05186 [Colletotrichum musicola]